MLGMWWKEEEGLLVRVEVGFTWVKIRDSGSYVYQPGCEVINFIVCSWLIVQVSAVLRRNVVGCDRHFNKLCEVCRRLTHGCLLAVLGSGGIVAKFTVGFFFGTVNLKHVKRRSPHKGIHSPNCSRSIFCSCWSIRSSWDPDSSPSKFTWFN